MGGPPLDGLTLHRVVAVRGPDSVGAPEDAEVDAAASAGAGLDLQGGVTSLEVVDQAVESLGLSVYPGPVGAVRDALDRFVQVTVVVPLEVVDGVVGDELVQRFQEVGEGILVGEVDDVNP